MAMERLPVIKDTHAKNVTALAYNPARHELLAGFEDGVIKSWDYSSGEPGKAVRTFHEHGGWITCFLFWSDAKLMLSASNDGYLMAWGSGFQPHDKVQIGSPVYAMAWNPRREQLVLGMTAAVRVYKLKARDQGHIVNKKGYIAKDHTDIVRNVICHETRVYSAGYDRRIVIYDSYSYPGKGEIKPAIVLYPAHDAGITCLAIAKDSENNTWLFSGSFDKIVKVWSQDGQIMHRFDSFNSTIRGLCYVRQTKTIWISSGTYEAPMYDPKSGENVSEFIGTFQNLDEESSRHELCLLQYEHDIGQVFGTNSRRQILCWKYNPSGCITALRNRDAVECLTYTRKVPILVFSGDAEGETTKWERLQSNMFMYSKEIFHRSEAIGRLASQITEKDNWASMDAGQIKDQLLKKQAPSFSGKQEKIRSQLGQENSALLKSVFVEDLDLLITSSEDRNIYVWGFDEKAVEVLKRMRPVGDFFSKRFEILLNENDLPSEIRNEGRDASLHQDSVTNRVAGFICKQVLTEHKQVVSALAVVSRNAGFGGTYLLSSGWDRRILLWDLETLRLLDAYRARGKAAFEDEELAADGIILDMAFSESRKEFAYAASDKLVYIRKFSTSGHEMTLSAVLQGHEAEVARVIWNPIFDKWVTGSEDGTIRIWSANGMSCELVLNAHGNVSALCIDRTNGCIVVGVQDTIRVYDPEYRKIVQTNVGHTDSVRDVIHIPERHQYVSASWDKTVRVWNAYCKTQRKKLKSKDDD